MKNEYDIFISYRREGGFETARIIYDYLRDHGYNAFFDVETLRSGIFNKKLYDVIENCRDVIVVLGPDSLSRCHNEDDWLRLEIAHAIKFEKNIIPVLTRGFSMPAPESLPKDIQPLVHYNGLNASPEYFDAFMLRLIKFLASRPSKSVVISDETAPKKSGSYWCSGLSIIFFILICLCFAGDSINEMNTLIGSLVMAVSGAILGIIGFIGRKRGKYLSFVGVILHIFLLFALCGVLLEREENIKSTHEALLSALDNASADNSAATQQIESVPAPPSETETNKVEQSASVPDDTDTLAQFRGSWVGIFFDSVPRLIKLDIRQEENEVEGVAEYVLYGMENKRIAIDIFGDVVEKELRYEEKADGNAKNFGWIPNRVRLRHGATKEVLAGDWSDATGRSGEVNLKLISSKEELDAISKTVLDVIQGSIRESYAGEWEGSVIQNINGIGQVCFSSTLSIEGKDDGSFSGMEYTEFPEPNSEYFVQMKIYGEVGASGLLIEGREIAEKNLPPNLTITPARMLLTHSEDGLSGTVLDMNNNPIGSSVYE